MLFLLVLVFFGLCESTRWDRMLLRRLAFSFDFVYLLILLGLYVTTSIYMGVQAHTLSTSEVEEYSNQNMVLNLTVFTASLFAALNLDALPHTSVWIKIVFLIGVTLNLARLIVLDQTVKPQFLTIELCFVTCADTRRMSLSFLITFFIFCSKYLVGTIRFPDRFSLLRVPLKYRVVAWEDHVELDVDDYQALQVVDTECNPDTAPRDSVNVNFVIVKS
eukprot:TRINITY_DN1206_c0_g1_i2.p1 TRINITY_DN1206_c0_g1~~TRINITY_DN1206_c0_g1_i2.p1  ORF type:complete len:219 (-),score=6.87 TRINITY_DN1206_c0_g1_i2:40-696(-)